LHKNASKKFLFTRNSKTYTDCWTLYPFIKQGVTLKRKKSRKREMNGVFFLSQPGKPVKKGMFES